MPEISKKEENVRPPYMYWASQLKVQRVTSLGMISSSTRDKLSMKEALLVTRDLIEEEQISSVGISADPLDN